MGEWDAEAIRSARRAADWSLSEAVRAMKRTSKEPLPTVRSLQRAWVRWEAGTTKPSRRYQCLLAEVLDSPDFASAPARSSTPPVWRRWLAFELRRLREEAGLTQKQAAKACSWSPARLGLIEGVQ